MSTIAVLSPPVARIDTVLSSFGMAIAQAIIGAGIPGGTVFVGWPNPNDLREALARGKFLVSIYPLPVSRRLPLFVKLGGYIATQPVVNLTATVVGPVLTFGGAAQGELNIHTLFGSPTVDAYYRTTDADTFSTIAANVASIVNSLGIDDVLAVPMNAMITFTGTIPKCNVGGTGTITREVDRIERHVQVSIWAPSGDNPHLALLGLRTAVADAITSNVGTFVDPYLALTDGTSARVKYLSEASKDASQSDFDMYEHHLIYTMEYGIIQTSAATQVGAITQTDTLPGGTVLTNIQG